MKVALGFGLIGILMTIVSGAIMLIHDIFTPQTILAIKTHPLETMILTGLILLVIGALIAMFADSWNQNSD